MAKATAQSLRAARTKTVTIDIEDPDTGEWVPNEFVIQRAKAGHRKQLQADCIDVDGMLDLEHATRLSASLCSVDPVLTEEDVEEMDLDVLVELSNEIAKHSNHRNVRSLATPDPKEGSEAIKSFRLADEAPGVGVGVDADPADVADGVDA